MTLFSGKHDVQSPEWWANRLDRAIRDRNAGKGWAETRLANKRGTRPGLDLLDAWLRNEPPLPTASAEWVDAWSHVLRITRTNAAELVVSSRSERIIPLGWKTAVDGDADGDAAAEVIARRTDLRSAAQEAIEDMLGLGSGYMLTGPDAAGKAAVTRESPMSTITADDPTGRSRAGLRLVVDEWTGEDEAWLYLAGGEVRVARKARSGYAWVEGEGGRIPGGRFPLTHLRNKNGEGEFERHLADCRRINDSLFNRVVLTKLQSHRQRALEKPALQDGRPEVEIEFDPADFGSGPDALWDLPPGVKVWESVAAELTSVRGMVDDDFKILAANTKTPVWMMLPGSQNQSATGSENAEGAYLALVADRQHRVDIALSRVVANAFAVEGDDKRSDPTQVRTLWAPQERYSLTDKAQAVSALAGKMPFDRIMTDVWQVAPSDLAELNAARGRDLFFQAPGQPPVSGNVGRA